MMCLLGNAAVQMWPTLRWLGEQLAGNTLFTDKLGKFHRRWTVATYKFGGEAAVRTP